MLIQFFEETLDDNFFIFSCLYYSAIFTAFAFPRFNFMAIPAVSAYYFLSFSSYASISQLLFFYTSLLLMAGAVIYLMSQVKYLILDLWDKFQKETHDHYITKENAIKQEKHQMEKSRLQRADLVSAMKKEMDQLEFALADKYKIDIEESFENQQKLKNEKESLNQRLSLKEGQLTQLEKKGKHSQELIDQLSLQLQQVKQEVELLQIKHLESCQAQEQPQESASEKQLLGKIKDLSNQLKDRQNALEETRRQLFENQSLTGLMEAEIEALKYCSDEQKDSYQEASSRIYLAMEQALKDKEEEIESLNQLIDSLSQST